MNHVNNGCNYCVCKKSCTFVPFQGVWHIGSSDARGGGSAGLPASPLFEELLAMFLIVFIS